MSLIVKTTDPLGLLQEIKQKIDAGVPRTWAYNAKGHFTHTPPQWKEQAWLRPIPDLGALRFEIDLPEGEVKKGVEGVYKGRFATMLRNHFGYDVIESSTHEQPALSSRSEPSKRSRTKATGKSRTKNISRPRKARTRRAGEMPQPIHPKRRRTQRTFLE